VGDPAHSRGLKPDEHCGPFQPRPFCDSVISELMEIAFVHELYLFQRKMRDKMLMKESRYGFASSSSIIWKSSHLWGMDLKTLAGRKLSSFQP